MMDSQLNQIEKVVVVGTGLLGVSLGLALKQAGYGGRLLGVARRQTALDEAVATGGIDSGATQLSAELLASEQGGWVLVIVAVPLSGFDAVFSGLAKLDHPKLLVSDVGSTKVDVHAAAARHLPELSRFVGSHPMAGSEKRGPTAGRADLFAGKPCIVTREPGVGDAAAEPVETMWQALGMPIVRMAPLEHDQAVAAVSHLPHVAAVHLVRLAEQAGGTAVASTGFKDTTRLASSNPPMRADILDANRTEVAKMIRQYAADLLSLADELDAADREAVLQRLEGAKAFREAWLSERGCDQEKKP